MVSLFFNCKLLKWLYAGICTWHYICLSRSVMPDPWLGTFAIKITSRLCPAARGHEISATIATHILLDKRRPWKYVSVSGAMHSSSLRMWSVSKLQCRLQCRQQLTCALLSRVASQNTDRTKKVCIMAHCQKPQDKSFYVYLDASGLNC